MILKLQIKKNNMRGICYCHEKYLLAYCEMHLSEKSIKSYMIGNGLFHVVKFFDLKVSMVFLFLSQGTAMLKLLYLLWVTWYIVFSFLRYTGSIIYFTKLFI